MKTVVVTGGTGYLAQALIARLLADQQVRVAATYLSPAEAVAFEARFGTHHDRIFLRRVNAADSQAVEGFFAELASTWDGICGLACLAGNWAGGRTVAETSDLRLDRMLDANLRSTFTTVRAALPYLERAEWARVVLAASRAALDTPPGQAAFNIAKAGVVALGRTLSAELRQTNVSVSVLVPSVIDTPPARRAMPDADHDLWPSPDAVARVLEFLLSRESWVLDGAEVPV